MKQNFCLLPAPVLLGGTLRSPLRSSDKTLSATQPGLRGFKAG